MTDETRSRTFVTAFARGLRVIEAFGPEAPRMSLSEVAERTGLDRAVARRFLLTLVELGFVATDGKQFELTPRVLRLGYSYLAAARLDSVLQADLDALSRRIGESVSVSVLDGDEIVFVARSDAAGRPLAYLVTTGTRMPALASSSGRLLLSTLPAEKLAPLLAKVKLEAYTKHTITDRPALAAAIAKAAADGYAVNNQEIEEGLVALSVLLRNRAGKPVAALNANSHIARKSRAAMLREILPALREFAEHMSKVLL